METGIDSLGPALLFCPGDRPERFAKARAAADTVILDLEDGVAAADKDRARDEIVMFLHRDPERCVVRINHPTTKRGGADAAAVLAAGCRTLLLPKTESAAEIELVAGIAREHGPASLIITVETAFGLLALPAILGHGSVDAVSWGPYDLAADLGMPSPRGADGRFLGPIALARDRLVLQAAASRVMPIDTVTAEFGNPELLARDVADAAALGFQAKFAIHPSQVEGIRAGFRPSDAMIERSRRMLAAGTGVGAYAFEGEMIDEPILRRARRILAIAEGRLPR